MGWLEEAQKMLIDIQKYTDGRKYFIYKYKHIFRNMWGVILAYKGYSKIYPTFELNILFY